MRKVLFMFETISFWGVFFLVSLFVGFNISLKDLYHDAIYGNLQIIIFANYLLLSIPTFIMLVIINHIQSYKNGITFFEAITIAIPALVWTPYKGIDIREIFKFKKLNMTGFAIAYDISILLRRIVEMIIWWGTLIYAIKTVLKTPSCVLAKTMNEMYEKEIVFNIGMIFFSIILLNIVGWVLSRIQSRKWKEQFDRIEKETKGTLGQRYFNKHPEHMPSGCSACGGPYPECRESCSLFDE